MSCGSECLSVGPPPDSILRMPPPPLPAFLASAGAANLTPPCKAARCPPHHNNEVNALFPGVEYHELPRHGQWRQNRFINKDMTRDLTFKVTSSSLVITNG